MKIYPNCSEIIWRLAGEKGETWTDSFPNDALTNFIRILKDNPEADDLEFVDNNGGGGNWDYVERVFNVAREIFDKKLPSAVIEKIDDRLWNDSDYLGLIEEFERIKQRRIDLRGRRVGGKYTIVRKHPRRTKRKKTIVKKHLRRR